MLAHDYLLYEAEGGFDWQLSDRQDASLGHRRAFANCMKCSSEYRCGIMLSAAPDAVGPDALLMEE
jgi:hypothetical protein